MCQRIRLSLYIWNKKNLNIEVFAHLSERKLCRSGLYASMSKARNFSRALGKERNLQVGPLCAWASADISCGARCYTGNLVGSLTFRLFLLQVHSLLDDLWKQMFSPIGCWAVVVITMVLNCLDWVNRFKELWCLPVSMASICFA